MKKREEAVKRVMQDEKVGKRNRMLYMEPAVEAQRRKGQGLMEMLEQTLGQVVQHIKQTEERVRTTDELLERNAAKGTKACDT